MIDMTYWCESCARKNNCYTIKSRPKCFTPITSNDRTVDHKTEPQTDYKKWETPPKFEHKGIITTCVSVPMALIEDKRCIECRHWSYGKDICNLHDMGMMAEDYCSYWERK